MFTEPLSKFLNYEKPIPNRLLIVILLAFYMAMDSLNGEKFACTFDFGALFPNSTAKRKQFVQIVWSFCIWWERKFMQCHLFLNYDFLFVAQCNQTKSRAIFPIHCVCEWNFSALMKASKNDKSHCFRILIILSKFGNRKERNEKRENLNTYGYFGPKKCVTLRLLNRSRRQFPLKTMLLYSFHSMRYCHWTGLFFCFK